MKVRSKMSSNTSLIQIRSKLNSNIERKEIDDNLACKVVIKFSHDEKLTKVYLKHSVSDCKKNAFKQARSYLRKFNVTASLAQRSDVTLTHQVVSMKINEKTQKVNLFTYTVHAKIETLADSN